MSAVAPKTFNQLRFFTTAFVGITGFYQGANQKSANQAKWDNFYAAKFKENAAKHEAEAAAKRGPVAVSADIPAELHELVQALSK